MLKDLVRQVFVEMHLIDKVLDVETFDRITKKVEKQVESRLQVRFPSIRVLIHVELPADKSDRITSDFLENQASFPQT